MNIREIFNLGLQMGKQADLRGEQVVGRFLQRKKEKYNKLGEKDKPGFDLECLENPYLDSRILHINQGEESKEIKKILIGVDMEPAEILLAKQLGDVDLVIAHHPEGIGLANLADVMALQVDVLNQYGVPVNIAEGLMKIRISEVDRGLNSANHQRAVDIAKILGVNFICLHTPLDNLAARFLKDLIESKEKELYCLSDLLDELKKIPEYKEAQKLSAGPKIFVGSLESRCGKIAITEITGGTEGSPKLYEKMAQAGIGTIIGMHQSEEHRKEAEAANVNVVIAGHMSSDSLGINIFLDELAKQGIGIVPCSGLIRISRNS